MAEGAQPGADTLLDGAVALHQPAHGYRAGMDAVLLAAAVEGAAGARLLDAGCGAGAALVCAAWRLSQTHFVGLEREPAMAALAVRNVAANGLEGRVTVIEGDLFQGVAAGPFDGALCNPPFAQEGEGRAPAPARRHAHVTEADVGRWVAALSNRLRGGAALTLIHRADRLAALIAACEGRLGGLEIFPVRPRTGAPAHRVLVRARKGSRAPLRLYAGLDLHTAEGGAHSPEAQAIWRGAALPWR